MTATGFRRLSSIALLVAVVSLVSPGATPALASGSCLVKNRSTGVVFPRTTGDSLQVAIDAAVEGEALVVRGRCVGSYVIERTLTVLGVETPSFPVATLDANGGPTVITIDAGAVILRRLVVTGGHGISVAGGIANGGAGKLVLAHTWVTGNRADTNGGGIYHVGDSLRLRDSRVSQNRSRFGGGAAYSCDPMAPDGIGGGVRTCDTVLSGVGEGVNVLHNVPDDIRNCR